MFKYRRAFKRGEKSADNEVRIRSTGMQRNYLRYVANLVANRVDTIIVRGIGSVIPKAIALASLAMRKFKGMAQIVDIGTTEMNDEYFPLEEGLDNVVLNNKVPFVTITLSFKELPKEHPGYSPALPDAQIEPYQDMIPGGWRGRGQRARRPYRQKDSYYGSEREYESSYHSERYSEPFYPSERNYEPPYPSERRKRRSRFRSRPPRRPYGSDPRSRPMDQDYPRDRDREFDGGRGYGRGSGRGYGRYSERGFERGSDRGFGGGYDRDYDRGSNRKYDHGYDLGSDRSYYRDSDRSYDRGSGRSDDRGYDRSYDRDSDSSYERTYRGHARSSYTRGYDGPARRMSRRRTFKARQFSDPSYQ